MVQDVSALGAGGEHSEEAVLLSSSGSNVFFVAGIVQSNNLFVLLLLLPGLGSVEQSWRKCQCRKCEAGSGTDALDSWQIHRGGLFAVSGGQDGMDLAERLGIALRSTRVDTNVRVDDSATTIGADGRGDVLGLLQSGRGREVASQEEAKHRPSDLELNVLGSRRGHFRVFCRHRDVVGRNGRS